MQELVKQLENFTAEYRRELRESAQALLDQKMPVPTEELFALYEQNGNRLRYEAVYFARRKMLAVLGLEAIVEKESGEGVSEALLSKLCSVMEDICGEECWALPAHVNRREDADWRVTVDLFASETAQTLSELLDRLRDELPERLQEKIIGEVERRVLQPFFTSPVPYRNWECADMNWNAVCAGSIGSVCLHLMRDDRQRLEKCLKRICDGLVWYIKGFSEDGACMEGMGYYTYGMTYFANFAQELYEYTGGKQDLFCGEWGGFETQAQDRRAKIAGFPVKCFFPDGRTLCFSDGFSRDTFRVGLLCVLGMHYEQVPFPGLGNAAGLHSDSCYRFAGVKMDMLYTGRYLEALRKKATAQETRENSAFYVLPAAQWCMGHSANGVGFACKGGNNDEPHNHNDIGHFLYEAGGVMLLTDLGCGEYTKQYFSEGRYLILCNNSFGHSVPVLNGQGQCTGAEYGCRAFEAQADGTVRMEIGGAYAPVGAAGKETQPQIDRELKFDLQTGGLEVKDRFLAAAEEVLENLVTQIPPQLDGNDIILEQDGVKARVVIAGLDRDSLRILEYDHSNHSGEMEKVYAVQWRVAMQENRGESAFSVTLG